MEEAAQTPRDIQLLQWFMADLGTRDNANEIHDALARAGVGSLPKLLHMFEPTYKQLESADKPSEKLAAILRLGGLPEATAMVSSFYIDNMFRKHIQSDSKGSRQSTTLNIKQQRGWASSKGTKKTEEGGSDSEDARTTEERDGAAAGGPEGLETRRVDGEDGPENKTARPLMEKKADDQSKVVGLIHNKVSTAEAVTTVLTAEFDIQVIKAEEQGLDKEGRPAQKVVVYNPSTPVLSWGQMIGDGAYVVLYELFEERFEIILKAGETRLENKYSELEKFEKMARDQVEYRRKQWMQQMVAKNETEAIAKAKLKKGKHAVKSNFRARMLAGWDPTLTGMPPAIAKHVKKEVARAPSILVLLDNEPIAMGEEEEELDAIVEPPAHEEEITLDPNIFQNAPPLRGTGKIVFDSDDKKSGEGSEEESGDQSEEESAEESEEESGEESDHDEELDEESGEELKLASFKEGKMDLKRKSLGRAITTKNSNSKKAKIAATNKKAKTPAVNKPFKIPTRGATVEGPTNRNLRSRDKK